MRKLITIIFFLFVVQEAFPQFNSVEFQKGLPSVQVLETRDVYSISEKIGSKNFPELDKLIKEERNVLLASLPLEDFSMTSNYGFRSDPFSGERKFHRGIDLKANHSQVLSMLHGEVIAVGHGSLLGNFVKVRHGKYEALYGHLSQIKVAKGEDVLPGTLLGISGRTGKATGDHLHLTIKKGKEYINPSLFIRMISKLKTKEDLIHYLSN